MKYQQAAQYGGETRSLAFKRVNVLENRTKTGRKTDQFVAVQEHSREFSAAFVAIFFLSRAQLIVALQNTQVEMPVLVLSCKASWCG